MHLQICSSGAQVVNGALNPLSLAKPSIWFVKHPVRQAEAAILSHCGSTSVPNAPLTPLAVPTT